MSEVLRTHRDKITSAFPKERARRYGDNIPRPPALWAITPALHMPGISGAFPRGFLDWLLGRLGRPAHQRLLHVCSGGLGPGARGIRVDIRPEMAPDVVADGRSLPFADETFDAVVVDPPYTVELAEDLYGVKYPRPSHLLAEASRVARPCAAVVFLHFLVPTPPRGLALEQVYGLMTGCGYRIRAVTILRKEQRGLFSEAQ